MVTQQKIQAVKKELRSGIPEGEIKNRLQQEGFTDEEIKTIFSPRNYSMRSWYLFSAVILMIIGLWANGGNPAPLLFIFSGILLILYFQENKRHNT